MSPLDWVVVVILCGLSLGVGLYFTKRSAKGGASGYFTGNRSLPWWAIGLSNTATYSSGGGAFVMLVLVFGLVGNWFWWGAWIIWMPLVAIVWARMWRRMQIVTTAELITLRYGGRPALLARKVYAFLLFSYAVLIIGYITGFFAKTIKPLVPLSEAQILLIFGGITVVYTVFGGLIGVVFTDIMQFIVFLSGNLAFFFLAVPKHGGWSRILARAESVRPDVLQQLPPTPLIPVLTVVMLVVQGLFFAGSPTAGEGMTAQRFMAAKNEKHAMAGQLFNSFLALSLRTIPLIGLGVIAFSLFWTRDLVAQIGPAPAGMKILADPAYAWGELIKASGLPHGFVGVLVAAELAAFMSALSSLINWGSSLVVNDFYRSIRPNDPPKTQIVVSRVTVLCLFIFAAAVSIVWVKGMVSWFLFINSVMVIFILPLSWLRFFWWRFNVWGELAAFVLGLPLSVLVWFVLGFEKRPFWQGTGLLFLVSFATLVTVCLLTPPESREVLVRFYEKCRPPGRWKGIRELARVPPNDDPPTSRLVMDCAIGVAACFGLVVATNAVFARSWLTAGRGGAAAAVFGGFLLHRVLGGAGKEPAPSECREDEGRP
ncbi:MAG: sodium:solute symporter [Acidobacteriota bacterium]